MAAGTGRLPWAQVPAALRRAAERQLGGAVTAVLAALAGFFVGQSRQPDPPGLPTVRAFQAAHGAVTLDWLRLRTGWR